MQWWDVVHLSKYPTSQPAYEAMRLSNIPVHVLGIDLYNLTPPVWNSMIGSATLCIFTLELIAALFCPDVQLWAHKRMSRDPSR